MGSEQTRRAYSGPQHVFYYLGKLEIFAKIKGDNDEVLVLAEFGGVTMFRATLPDGSKTRHTDFNVVKRRVFKVLGIEAEAEQGPHVAQQTGATHPPYTSRGPKE